jgi:hypothetical protein
MVNTTKTLGDEQLIMLPFDPAAQVSLHLEPRPSHPGGDSWVASRSSRCCGIRVCGHIGTYCS